MKYQGETIDGKKIIGNAVQYEGFEAWIVVKTPTGCTKTKVLQSSIREVDEQA